MTWSFSALALLVGGVAVGCFRQKGLAGGVEHCVNQNLVNSVMNKVSFRNRSFCRVLALCCLVLFVSLQAVALSELLHRALHADASTPGHACAVTLLSKGQVESFIPTPLVLKRDAGLLLILPLRDRAAVSSFDYRLSPSRAPPLA